MKEKKELIYKDYEEAFDKLIKAFSEFNDVIDKHKNTINFNAFVDHETYPFEESFDEYSFLIDGWKEQTLENLEKIEDLEEANRGW
jgi:hypothetical protein